MTQETKPSRPGQTFNNPARPAPGTPLCRADEIADGEARRFTFREDKYWFRGMLVRSDAGLNGFVNYCAHVGVPLQDDRDELYRQDGLIVCAWHFARYDPRTGAAVDGPCVGSLPPWPIAVGDDGVVRTAPWSA